MSLIPLVEFQDHIFKMKFINIKLGDSRVSKQCLTLNVRLFHVRIQAAISITSILAALFCLIQDASPFLFRTLLNLAQKCAFNPRDLFSHPGSFHLNPHIYSLCRRTSSNLKETLPSY